MTRIPLFIRIHLIAAYITISHFDIHADATEDYIAAYHAIATENCRQYRIPASITLAQGILESQVGRSPLATEGNNHFGIKCGSQWTAATIHHDDDKDNECFRSYGSAEESYADHARFLMKKRYSSLFELDPTDYKGWAKGLKECGYATDPKYARKLIDLIERYRLYDYDISTKATDAYRKMLEEIMAEDMELHTIRRKDGVYYVVANEGDTYKAIANELGMKEKQLRRFNSAPKKATLLPGDIVYLQDPTTND